MNNVVTFEPKESVKFVPEMEANIRDIDALHAERFHGVPTNSPIGKWVASVNETIGIVEYGVVVGECTGCEDCGHYLVNIFDSIIERVDADTAWYDLEHDNQCKIFNSSGQLFAFLQETVNPDYLGSCSIPKLSPTSLANRRAQAEIDG